MKIKTILKTAELEHLADIEREGDGIGIVMRMPRQKIEHTWSKAARVNLAQSVRRMR